MAHVATASEVKTPTRAHKGQSPMEPPPVGTFGMWRLGDLVSTDRNVSKAPRTKERIRRMAITIHHHGRVVQSLALLPILDDQGRWTGKLGAAAGETRRLALEFLRDGGIEGAEGYTDDFMVPGLIVADPEAAAVSLTENIQREPMHPADQYLAFKELVDETGSVEHVAAMFATEPEHVERMLRLANASPKLFEAFRAGGISLDQLIALCVVEDHAMQERVWNAARRSPYMQEPSRLRQALTNGKVSFSDRLPKFVGIEAYEAAGGRVLRDLFATDASGCYAEDVQLLQRLAIDKLEAAAAPVREEGWAWVDASLDFDTSSLYRLETCKTFKRKLSEDEAKRQAAAEDRLQTVRKQIEQLLKKLGDEADTAQLRYEASQLQLAVRSIEESRVRPDKASKDYAGAIVYVDHQGQLVIVRGKARPQDVRAAERAATKQRKAQLHAKAVEDGTAPEAPASAEISASLARRLAVQRTMALQLVVARNTPLALVALADRLVSDVLTRHDGYQPKVLQISLSPVRPGSVGFDEAVTDAPATVELEEDLAAWRERIPAKERRFEWLMQLPQDELLRLIGLCAAVTISATDGNPLTGTALQLARAAGLQMADWWEATGDSYLNSVPKSLVQEAVAEGVSKEAAVPLANLKKGEAVARAEVLLAGRRWVPELLRIPA